MTDTRATQVGVEHWLAPSPSTQATQAALEHWATVGSSTVLVLATQIAIEHWASALGAGGSAQASAMVLA